MYVLVYRDSRDNLFGFNNLDKSHVTMRLLQLCTLLLLIKMNVLLVFLWKKKTT
jgi:hypothetical protein